MAFSILLPRTPMLGHQRVWYASQIVLRLSFSSWVSWTWAESCNGVPISAKDLAGSYWTRYGLLASYAWKIFMTQQQLTSQICSYMLVVSSLSVFVLLLVFRHFWKPLFESTLELQEFCKADTGIQSDICHRIHNFATQFVIIAVETQMMLTSKNMISEHHNIWSATLEN